METGAAAVDHRRVKTHNHAVTARHSVDPACCQEAFEGPLSRIRDASHGSNPDAGRKLVLGLLSVLFAQELWTIAEWAWERIKDGLQPSTSCPGDSSLTQEDAWADEPSAPDC